MAAEIFTVPNLGPRPKPAASYFKRANRSEDNGTSSQDQPPESDLLKSIKQVIRPSQPHEMRHSQLYPCGESLSDEYLSIGNELSWNSNCVVLSTGSVILRKWTLDYEGQDIRWACKGLFLEPGGVIEGNSGPFATGSSNDSGTFISSSESTFSRFAQNAHARQRAVELPRRLHAVYVFLRNLGKIYVEGGGDYTFHIPFLVRCAWPIRPHGVLIERELGVNEIRESMRLRQPILPTLFSLHDPFAEPKVVGVAARIHGAFGPNMGIPTAISPSDPSFPPETKTPDDFSMSGGYKPTPVSAMQAEAPPPPPKRHWPPPLHKTPPTDRVLWVSEDITCANWAENLVVTWSYPVHTPRPPTAPAPTHPSKPFLPPQQPSTNTNTKPPPRPGHHRYAHQMHLTVWRYGYLKPREVPDPVPSRRKKPPVPPPSRPPDSETGPTTSVAPILQPRDPEAARRRELQDRADRITPSSPDVSTPSTDINFPPSLPGDAALPITAPRQPIGAQPTLASLPGGELPPSWGHPPPNITDQVQERSGSQDRGRRSSLSVTMDRMVLDTAGPTPGGTGEGVDRQQRQPETSTPTFMSSGHMKMQPSVWFEKISAVPIPLKE